MLVGTKELKNRLSHYLRRVRGGEVVRVTDRDVVIAEIRAVRPAQDDNLRWLQQLEADGLVTVGEGKFSDFEPIAIKGRRISRDILDDRR